MENVAQSKWLKVLQQRSWELELLVVGFSIFLLLGAPAALDQARNDLLSVHSRGAFSVFVMLLINGGKYSALLLATNLIIHIILRGFWIGLVGLSSAFPQGMALGKMGMSPLMEEKIRSRIPPLEPLIVRLDKFCGSLFAFSFLIVGIIISTGIFLTVLAFLDQLPDIIFRTNVPKSSILGIITILCMVTWVFLFLIFLFNFLTLGLLTKTQKISRFYAAIDLLVSRASLSFLYRPIYYMLASHWGKRRITLLISAYLICIGGISIRFDKHLYVSMSYNAVEAHKYDALRQPGYPIVTASIQKMVIDTNNLQLFVPLDQTVFEMIQDDCLKDQTNLTPSLNLLGLVFGPNQMNEKQKRSNEVLKFLDDLLQVEVGHRPIKEVDFLYMAHPDTGQKGIVTVIEIDAFPRGQNQVAVYLNDPAGRRPIAVIPFWKTTRSEPRGVDQREQNGTEKRGTNPVHDRPDE